MNRVWGCGRVEPARHAAAVATVVRPPQANVSRAKAIKALRNTDSDVVSAIMELTC